jgi:hypothetical protein
MIYNIFIAIKEKAISEHNVLQVNLLSLNLEIIKTILTIIEYLQPLTGIHSYFYKLITFDFANSEQRKSILPE